MYPCFPRSVSYCRVTNQVNFRELKTKSIYHCLRIKRSSWMVLLACIGLRHTFMVSSQWGISSSAWLDSISWVEMTSANWNLFHMISQSIWLDWVCSHGRGKVPRKSGSTWDQWSPAWTGHILIFTVFYWPKQVTRSAWGRANPFHLLKGGTEWGLWGRDKALGMHLQLNWHIPVCEKASWCFNKETFPKPGLWLWRLDFNGFCNPDINLWKHGLSLNSCCSNFPPNIVDQLAPNR